MTASGESPIKNDNHIKIKNYKKKNNEDSKNNKKKFFSQTLTENFDSKNLFEVREFINQNNKMESFSISEEPIRNTNYFHIATMNSC